VPDSNADQHSQDEKPGRSQREEKTRKDGDGASERQSWLRRVMDYLCDEVEIFDKDFETNRIKISFAVPQDEKEEPQNPVVEKCNHQVKSHAHDLDP